MVNLVIDAVNAGTGKTQLTSSVAGDAAFSVRASATSGSTYGLFGLASSTAGIGVNGTAGASTGANIGVRGLSMSASGTGVNGSALATTGTGVGVFGGSNSVNGVGVFGSATAAGGTGVKAWGGREDVWLGRSGILSLTARSTDPPAIGGLWRMYLFDNGTTRALRILGPSGTVNTIATLTP